MKNNCGKKFLSFILKPLAYIVAWSPQIVRNVLAWGISILWWDVLRIRRKVVLDNLKRAFPELSDRERKRMGRLSLFHMGLTITEFCYFPFFTKEWLPKKIRFEGLEHLDSALAQGKGVLVLTLHLGNGDLAMMGMAHRGYPMYLISKRFKTRWLDELWFGLRGRHGTRFIDPTKSSFEILKALKRNQMVVFVLDQFMGPPVGGRTTFFGHETGTALGLAVMAERTKAPVIPGHTYRDSSGQLVVVFEPQLQIIEGADHADTHLRTTQRYNDEIERLVRKHPEQWMWLHKRWKPFR
jgi:KDO2-lipid IV(A) lauroyltransferase